MPQDWQDRSDEIRRAVSALTPEEVRELLDGILGAGGPLGAGGFAGPPRPEPIQLPEPPEEDLSLTVRVDVDGTSPPVWRRLVLDGDLTLDEVHEILQAAFGWLDYHLHRFWPGPTKDLWGGPFFTTPYDEDSGEEDTEGMLPEAEVQLDQVLREKGDRLFYTYDFGDNWTCTLKLETTAPKDPDTERAVCTAARLAGPLEDCGGVPGHQELVEGFRAGGLAGLPPELREWVPPGWDPFDEDPAAVNGRLALVGLSAPELLAAFEAGAGQEPVVWPPALEPLLDIATPDMVAELADLTRRARDEEPFGPLTETDLADLARPYRYLVELAGADGIPLTQAGWMKPVVVEQIYHDLGYARDWIGKGNREDLTAPVAALRAECQRVGLLRKHTGRLLRTRLAQGLTSNEDYLRAVGARVIRDKDVNVQAAQAHFVLLCAATGEASYHHRVPVAATMTRCGLRTTPIGVDDRHVIAWCRDVWHVLREASGLDTFDQPTEQSRRRVAGLARLMLWPEP